MNEEWNDEWMEGILLIKHDLLIVISYIQLLFILWVSFNWGMKDEWRNK